MNAERTRLAAASSYEGEETPGTRINRDRVALGELPDRYAEHWPRLFFELARPALSPDMSILDVGGGRMPTYPLERRPPGTQYVGWDVDRSELEAAGPAAYDEVLVGDIGELVPELRNRFDLIVSWQVLEHVESMQCTLDSMHAYLKPGGRMVSMLSGKFAAFALLTRFIPYSVSGQLMKSLLASDPERKFRTAYDSCDIASLNRLLAAWSSSTVIPRFNGASYFQFSRRLESLYLRYENWADQSGNSSLATHYVVCAIK